MRVQLLTLAHFLSDLIGAANLPDYSFVAAERHWKVEIDPRKALSLNNSFLRSVFKLSRHTV